MGLVTVAAILLLYRFSFQESKPYVPLQRRSTSMWNFHSPQSFSIKNQSEDLEMRPIKSVNLPISNCHELNPSFRVDGEESLKRTSLRYTDKAYDTFDGSERPFVKKSLSEIAPNVTKTIRQFKNISRSAINIPTHYDSDTYSESSRLLDQEGVANSIELNSKKRLFSSK
jgi:hypothetical protein